jgi:putative ABC transport system substrate-binding protein
MYLFHANAQGIVDVLARTGLPAIFPRHSFSERGGLMSLAPVHPGPEEARDPELLVRILAGASPAQLSVQVPTGFDLQINLKTAQALKLAPSAFALSRAVRLIE